MTSLRKRRASRKAPPEGGRPAYQPTSKDESIIRALVLSNNTQEDIARVMRIDPKTLRKYFRDILDLEKSKANATVVANLYRQATKDDFRAVGAAAFIAKTQMGWREKTEIDLNATVEQKIRFIVEGAPPILEGQTIEIADDGNSR